MSAPPNGSVPRPAAAAGTAERRDALMAAFRLTQGCVRCAELAATRHKVVFGAGNADAELMFVGEAPGASEDQEGLPFVGRAGKLLETLLGEIGLARSDVFIANVLKCRPPGNRDPLPVEIDNCQEYLFAQVELVAPRVICSLGNFSTKLLRRDPAGITRVHGRAEVITLGRRAVRLYPIFHPAAALYTPRMLETLRGDFAGLPALLAMPAPDQPAPPNAVEELKSVEEPDPVEEPGAVQEPGSVGAPQPAAPGGRTEAASPASPAAPAPARRPVSSADRETRQLGLF